MDEDIYDKSKEVLESCMTEDLEDPCENATTFAMCVMSTARKVNKYQNLISVN